MSDIVDWLREGYELMYTPDGSEIDPVATKEKLNKAADEITRLRQELAEAQVWVGRWQKLSDDFQTVEQTASAERNTLRQQLAVAREGLGFYANPENWKNLTTDPDGPAWTTMDNDEGDQARDTLAKLDESRSTTVPVDQMGEKG